MWYVYVTVVERGPDLSRFAPAGAPAPSLSRETFHDVFFRRLPTLSAADHGGWRYEYLSWTYRFGSSWRTDLPPGTPGSFVPGRGANALWDLCSLLFTGGLHGARSTACLLLVTSRPPAAPVAVRPRLTPWMDAARAGGVVVRELQ